MGDYVLSNAADTDLAEIYVYSHRSFGEAQADTYYSDLSGCLRMLADNPRLGRSAGTRHQDLLRHVHGAAHAEHPAQLHILLSFAQFEREVIGERIRDKFAASRRKGMWMGGVPPLGYDVVARKLVVNQPEADLVRHIFDRFLKVGSAILPSPAGWSLYAIVHGRAGRCGVDISRRRE